MPSDNRATEVRGALGWLGSLGMTAVALVGTSPAEAGKLASHPQLIALAQTGAFPGVTSPFTSTEEPRVAAIGMRSSINAMVGTFQDRAASASQKDAQRETLRETSLRLTNRAAGLTASTDTSATRAASAAREAAVDRVSQAAYNREALEGWLDAVLDPRLAAWLKGFGTVTLVGILLVSLGVPLATLAYFLSRRD